VEHHINDLKELENGEFEGYGEKHSWTKKSGLCELTCAKALILPHNIDLMHQKCNVVESIISRHFDVTNFTKDNSNARKHLASICGRPLLEDKANPRENLSRTQGPYCLKPIERKRCLSDLRH
jgi:hypothetical protein